MRAVASALECGLDELFGERPLGDGAAFRHGVRYAEEEMRRTLDELDPDG